MLINLLRRAPTHFVIKCGRSGGIIVTGSFYQFSQYYALSRREEQCRSLLFTGDKAKAVAVDVIKLVKSRKPIKVPRST